MDQSHCLLTDPIETRAWTGPTQEVLAHGGIELNTLIGAHSESQRLTSGSFTPSET